MSNMRDALIKWRDGYTSEQAVAAINATCGTDLSVSTYRNWEAGRPMSAVAQVAARLAIASVKISD